MDQESKSSTCYHQIVRGDYHGNSARHKCRQWIGFGGLIPETQVLKEN